MNNINHDRYSAKALLDQLIITAETYGWSELIGFEFILWEQLSAEASSLPPETIKQIKEKNEGAGGWWVWPKGIHNQGNFISMAEWDAVRANRNLP